MVTMQRNIVSIGHSKGITLPHWWIQLIEEKHGVSLTKVKIQIFGDELRITPQSDKENEKDAKTDS